jgi:phage anti-repressor protein
MTTMSFSVKDSIKRDFASWARRAKKSKSDLFRDMVAAYGFNQRLDKLTAKSEQALRELGIVSENELYEYLENDETYQDRLRHQRLSSGE